MDTQKLMFSFQSQKMYDFSVNSARSGAEYGPRKGRYFNVLHKGFGSDSSPHAGASDGIRGLFSQTGQEWKFNFGWTILPSWIAFL